MAGTDEWAAVMNLKDSTNYVLLHFPKKTKAAVLASGSGGHAEMITKLDGSCVVFGGFVVYGVDERGGVTSKREKLVHFSYTPSGISLMAQARAGQQVRSPP